MKPLRDGIVIWLQWAADGQNWFTELDDDTCLCAICGCEFDAGPRQLQTFGIPLSGRDEVVWSGVIKHGLWHIRESRVRRHTIEALETIAVLKGSAVAGQILLGISPVKQGAQ
jgi:hypothetical protein